MLRDAVRFPAVVKTSVGTASRGIWFVRDAGALDIALRDLEASGAFDDEVLVQDLIAGTTEKAQSVFCRGQLLGFHAYRQIAAGVGGGEAIKQSVSRPRCGRTSRRSATARLARCVVGRLHRARRRRLAIADRLQSAAGRADQRPSLRCRSRRAVASDIAGRDAGGAARKPPGVRTHLAMQALLGCASRDGTRRDVVRECRRLLTASGPYAGSSEELTPVDWTG